MLFRLLFVYIHVHLIFNSSYIKCQKSATMRTTTQNGDYEPPEIEVEVEDTTPGFSSTLNAENITNETKSVKVEIVTTPSTSKRETTTVSLSNSTIVTIASNKSLNRNTALKGEANIIIMKDYIDKSLKEQSVRNKHRKPDKVKTVAKKPLKVKNLYKPKEKNSRVELKHSFISGPDWHNLIKQPNVRFSSKISSNDIQSPFSFLNQLDEISFEQGWENLKSKDKNRLQSKKGLNQKKNRKITKTTTVWPKKKFKASAKLSKVRYPVEFRLSDILPNPENVKLFSFQDDVKSKETAFQYDHSNAISPFRTIFRFGNFQKVNDSPSKRSRKARNSNSNSNRMSRRKLRKSRGSNKLSKRNRKAYKKVLLESDNKLKHMKHIPVRSPQTNYIRRNRKRILQKLNHLKMNVEEMLFDVDHATDVIPFLMMGVAVP